MSQAEERYSVPYGKSELEFQLPEGMTGSVALSRKTEPLDDIQGAIAEALANRRQDRHVTVRP